MTDTATLEPTCKADQAETTPLPIGAQIVNGKSYLEDAKGVLHPFETIDPADLLEDEMVRKIMGYAEELAAQIKRFKAHTRADVYGLLALILQNYGVTKGGRKGNVTFTRFDGLAKVQVAVADQISFGPELNAAKALIDECLREWSSDSHAALRAIVESAFDVDKEGDVSPAKLFPLLRHKIDDTRWQRAMEAIVDAIQVRGTKEYFRFYRRPNVNANWEAVVIDLAAA